MENLEVDDSKPLKDVIIADSGEIPLEKPFRVEKRPVTW